MSMNYAFGFSLFLLILVALNVFFFYTLNTTDKKGRAFNVPSVRIDLAPGVFKDIYEFLNYLPIQYKQRNPKFIPIRDYLIQSFNSTNTHNVRKVLLDIDNWTSNESLFPHTNGARGQILQEMRASQIVLVDNAPKGTQLKLLLLLENKHKLYFKPKRYPLDEVINGNIYAGFDRHNSEVFSYYLAMILNYTWIPPSVIRRIHFDNDLMPKATSSLKKTMIKKDDKSLCIYGKCFYCKTSHVVCPDKSGAIEGAAILYFNKPTRTFRSPWARSYNGKKKEWQENNDFCKKVFNKFTTQSIINFVEVSIFDFLIQNGDRHAYETYKNKTILFDNGKGLGNPLVDELDILAPLYQCCILSSSTWQNLEALSGGSMTETIKLLSSIVNEKLATEEHFLAIERRLLKVYATVQYCIGKHGRNKVVKTISF